MSRQAWWICGKDDDREAFDLRSIAIPPLGCGNGGLDWSDVRPLIVAALSDLNDVDVIIYPPEGAPAADQMVIGTTAPG